MLNIARASLLILVASVFVTPSSADAQGLLARLRARCGRSQSNCCQPATCCKPAACNKPATCCKPCCATTATVCGTTCSSPNVVPAAYLTAAPIYSEAITAPTAGDFTFGEPALATPLTEEPAPLIIAPADQKSESTEVPEPPSSDDEDEDSAQAKPQRSGDIARIEDFTLPVEFIFSFGPEI